MFQVTVPTPGIGDRAFVRRTLIVLSLGALFFLAWQLRSVLLLLFGAVLIAVIFRSIAGPIRRWTKAPEGLAVALAVLLVAGIIGGASWMFGSEVSAQVRTLTQALPDAWRVIEGRISEWNFAENLDDMIGSAMPSGSGLLAGLSRFMMSFGSGLAEVLVAVVGGIYLAAQPQLYRTGALLLFPPQRRELAGKAFDESGRALRLWLKGQLFSMIVVGLLVGIGLWLIGVPSALALGLLAAVLEFIPLVGPLLAAIPALLIGLALGPQTALWVLGLYLLVQQIEGNILQPMVQQYAVDLPAVAMLFSLLGFGMLFGALGVVLAAPLTVVCFVLVKRLYVREALGTPTTIPGES